MITWSKNNHSRFGINDRKIVKTLLLIQRRTQFTPKDVLIYEILRRLLILNIPVIYVGDIPFDIKDDELAKFFNVPLETCKIARLYNHNSKGFAFIKCLKYDDAEQILKTMDFNYKGQTIRCVPTKNFY
jgi:RNA recognition motif-containing protein